MTELVRSPLRVLHLYRPRLPGARAQSIQVLGTCHGLAQLGCEVTLLADPPRDHMPVDELPTVEEVLDWYDLPPVAGLDLKLCPTSIPAAESFWFRKHALIWLWGALTQHAERSVILARSKRYVDEYLVLPFGPPVVLEAHEVDSRLVSARGEDARPWLKLEQRVLREVDGVVANCAGTLSLLEEVHGSLLPQNRRAVHNATNPRRVRDHLPGAGVVVGYAGSLRGFKGIETLLLAATMLPPGVTLELLGGTEEERASLGLLPENVRVLGELPYREVPDRIARWHAGIIALDDNLFGARLCNPLKLFDYRAVGLPLVAADLPSLREVVDADSCVFYNPGQPRDLARAITEALRPERRRGHRWRHLRSWRTRAEEILPVLEAALR